MVTATMVLARLGPRMATTRMASTRLGTAMIRSITRVMETSTTGPGHRGEKPSMAPMTKETLITAKPMNSDTRAP